ncbi:hypothetical protein V6N13_127618 [Hibiscus sabdariffa]|uniref:Uncharacterized protein n=1 Tax=Hibiscus sabdariffa TaxID=183260 RepID=A0ABR2CD61_9ROSI
MRNLRVNPTKENDPTFKYMERGTPKYFDMMSFGGGHETQEKLVAAFVAQSYGNRAHPFKGTRGLSFKLITQGEAHWFPNGQLCWLGVERNMSALMF